MPGPVEKLRFLGGIALSFMQIYHKVYFKCMIVHFTAMLINNPRVIGIDGTSHKPLYLY